VQLSIAQTAKITVSGKVTDPADGSPLPGVSIVEKGTTNGTSTDATGSYILSVPSDATLIFSFVGYKNQEVAVNNRTVIDVSLETDAQLLEDVVVVGYGTQKKSQITGAIASVDNKEFKDQPVTNLASSIQGRVSGLNVTTPSGTPGAGLLINIRGNNSPLYVVDGIPMISQSNSALSTSFDTEGNVVGNGQNLSSISDINPNDIESIEILKDASAASIYGARAANGVILITTKRGKSGKPSINFNAYYGVQQVSRPIDFMGSKEFVDLVEEARANDLAKYNDDPTYFGDGFDPSVLTDPLQNFDLTGVDTDWLKEVTRVAPISNYELSLGGGSDKTKYYTSFSYTNQQGIIINNYYDRLNYRLNLDQQVSDKLTVGTSAFLSYSRNKRSFNDNTYTGVITNIVGASPLMPVYDENGDYTDFTEYQATWLSDNPVKSAKEISALTTNTRVLGTAYVDYAFTPNLRFRTSASADLTYTVDDQFKSPITADAEAVGGEAFQANFNNTTWLNENILSYNKQMGQNNLNVMGGFTLQKSVSTRSSITGQGFPMGLDNISSAATITRATGTQTMWSLMSFLGRVNYSIQDKYLLTATIRSDGSSRFSEENRFGTFPSASVAWRISQEDFMKNSEVISDLKFRVSYGLTGDQEIGDFQYVSFYGPTRYYGNAGVKLRNIADPTLTWQENKMLNIGLDYDLFQGKLNGSVEFFQSTKSKLLSQDAIPGTTGFPTITRNSGEIQNTGFEFGLNARIMDKGDFQWNLGFNFTTIKNEVKSLTNDGILLSAYSDLAPTHIMKEGQPISSFWGVKYLGVDPATGDPMYLDRDEDGDVDGDDAMIIGKAFPDAFGGLTNNFKYKRFDLSVFVRYSFGNDVYNLIRPVYESLGYSNDDYSLNSVYSNNATTVRDRWQKPGDKTDVPRASFINANFYEGSSQFVEDGSFVRIQNVNLGYTMGGGKLFNSVRAYFEIQNLYVFSKYKGFDPEVSSTGGSSEFTAGVDYGAYPQARTFLVGINFNF
jgi:TonB-linked SusC/RagA family outer membrane protein